jgi:hypothetical protein
MRFRGRSSRPAPHRRAADLLGLVQAPGLDKPGLDKRQANDAIPAFQAFTR